MYVAAQCNSYEASVIVTLYYCDPSGFCISLLSSTKVHLCVVHNVGFNVLLLGVCGFSLKAPRPCSESDRLLKSS